ncbi:MAG: hypothetical protein PUC65_05145 [Clostridiales bacterium]|nr:hypothetical protein [Clostridiales bacterium]
MTEELQTLDLELKELFIKQDFEKAMELLDNATEEDVLEMTNLNWDVVKKYNDQGRTDLLRQHLTFVAYASFITEYSGKRGLFEEQVYQTKFDLFEEIFEKLQAER